MTMTREVAIAILEMSKHMATRGSLYNQAIDMAIEALSERTGEWILDPNGMDWNLPAWVCSECGFVANYIGVSANGLGNNPMNWAGSKFCPQCGVRITGYETEIGSIKG